MRARVARLRSRRHAEHITHKCTKLGDTCLFWRVRCGAFAACRAACGSCGESDSFPSLPAPDCVDSKTWRGAKKGQANPKQTCAWVAQQAKKRCKRKDVDKVKAKVACPVACGTCDAWIDKAHACSQCRQKDGVSSCENRWKCVFADDQCDGACVSCNKRNNDLCYQLEKLL